MKFAYALCIVLIVCIAGCGGKKEIQPSDDTLRSNEAMKLINSIQTAYEGKESEVLIRHIHPVLANYIISELSFDMVKLYFSPWVVRIKEDSTIIHADWQGTWVYGERVIKKRGMASFVFIDSPMKLVHIDGDNPFYTPPAGDEHNENTVPQEPSQSEPEVPKEDVRSTEAVPPSDQQHDVAEQPEQEQEPVRKDDQPSDLEPLKRSKLLYREHELVPVEQPDAFDGDGQKRFIVQAGAWKSIDYAQTALELIREYYPEAVIVAEGGFHKIRIKKMMTRQEGMLAIEGLEEKLNLRPVLIGLDAESPGDPTAEPPKSGPGNYFVQIGVWRNKAFADAAYSDLKQRYPEAVMTSSGSVHKVGIPVTGTWEEARARVRELKEKLNLDALIIEQ